MYCCSVMLLLSSGFHLFSPCFFFFPSVPCCLPVSGFGEVPKMRRTRHSRYDNVVNQHNCTGTKCHDACSKTNDHQDRSRCPTEKTATKATPNFPNNSSNTERQDASCFPAVVE